MDFCARFSDKKSPRGNLHLFANDMSDKCANEPPPSLPWGVFSLDFINLAILGA